MRRSPKRTTVAITPEHRRRLYELAAQKHERGISRLIHEAIEAYLAASEAERARRDKLLALGGSLSREQADRLREGIKRAREGWR